MNIKTNNNEKSIIAIEGLYHVIDPEIGLNVVDLGLIYELNFDDDDNRITCTMTLTTEFCPMGESITDNVRYSLQQAFGDHGIDINLIFNPPWNMEMISEEGRVFLGR